MIGAIVRDDLVENLIVIKEDQIEEMSAALGCEIVDANPYGLTVGDLRTPAGWTRNAGGEQMILPELEGKDYDSYTVVAAQNVELQNNIEFAESEGASMAAEEALSILSGEAEV